ncbi:MAG TPA: cytochrome c family protein [Alphaproteobacteria bacterium]|nr:cytochrome c family protein [Alphaproteobacteria bacterium]
MDSFEFNKIAGAVLMTLLIVTVIGHIGNFLVPEPAEGAHSVLAVATPEGTAPTQQANAPAGPAEIGPMLAKANPTEGAKAAKVCQTCHNFEEGKGAKIGPDLYGVVGRKVAGKDNFQYSDGLKKLGGEWTFDELNKWLYEPGKLVPGTKMTFAGIKNDQQRADVIAYLNTLSDKPLPLPQ